MFMENSSTEDMYEAKFFQSVEKLEKCQKEKDLKSCHPCPEFDTCEIRKEYVDAVYHSMSEDEVAEFDF
jgi:hypothetical protein